MPTQQSIYQEVLAMDNLTSGRLKTPHTTPDQMTCPSPTRPVSALDYCDQGLRTGQRPKSTPHYGMKGHTQVTTHSAKISRPKTAAVILGRTECDRVHQLEHEATRRHNFENHLPLKKSKPPPWQRNLEAPLVPVVTAPGYILSKSKSKYAITLKEDFFDHFPEDTARPSKPSLNQGMPATATNNQRTTTTASSTTTTTTTARPVGRSMAKRNYGDPERDSLIAQLQQQISDLTLYLEEERMNHKQTKQKAEEFLKDKVDELNSQHANLLRDLDREHKGELHKQKSDMEEEHKEYQTTTDKQISRMAKEIEFLQGAFESYKSTLHTESWDKWKVREDEMNRQHNDDKQQALHDLKMKLVQERNQERAASAKERQKALELLRKENKKEMDTLTRRFANAAADYQRLQKTSAELEETRTDLETITQAYNETCQQLTNVTHQLTDAKVKLMDWEKRFQEKITLVDDKYRQKLQELMSQNTELKRLFVQKCGELFNEKTHTEHQTNERVKTAKETMESLIKLRQRADVSIAVGGPFLTGPKPGKSRPVSAPGTRGEVVAAHETAGETTTKDSKSAAGFVSPYIYLEPDPTVEELREELLLSCRDDEGSKI